VTADEAQQYAVTFRAEFTKYATTYVMEHDRSTEPRETATTTTEVFDDFLGNFSNPILNDSIETKVNKLIEDELSVYLNSDRVRGLEVDILKWWFDQRHRFPVLYRMHCDYAAIQASSAASERAFSSAGKVISKDRCSLGRDTVSILMEAKMDLKDTAKALKEEMNAIMGRKQIKRSSRDAIPRILPGTGPSPLFRNSDEATELATFDEEEELVVEEDLLVAEETQESAAKRRKVTLKENLRKAIAGRRVRLPRVVASMKF